jgi:hypothetical protein
MFKCVSPHILVSRYTPILTGADTRQNVVGMSVVGPDFEKLKRFNLEELQQVSPKANDKASLKVDDTASPKVKDILQDE